MRKFTKHPRSSVTASKADKMTFDEYCQATWGIPASNLTADDKKRAEEEYHNVTKQPVQTAADATHKTDRRLSPTSVRYRGYLIVLDRGGDGYNIYDKHRELEDAGYSSLESAKKCVDDIIREENGGIKAAEETDTYWMAMRKFTKHPSQHKQVNSSTDTTRIPVPYNKYFEIDPPTRDADLLPGDRIEDYDCTFLAYLAPKSEYEDTLDMWPVLTDLTDYPVCDLVAGRLYPITPEDIHRHLGDTEYLVESSTSTKQFTKHPKKVTSSQDVNDYEDDIREISQEFTSENTSINRGKLPAIFKLIHLAPGTINIDYGGGKFDNVAEYLAPMDVINLVYDPYNRTPEHNREVIRTVKKAGGADSATCSNVLNVIKEPEVRRNVLENIRRLVKPEGVVYITVYEGSGKGNEGPTKSGYQLNRKTADYLAEIQEVFPDAMRKGKLIIAHPNGSVTASVECATDVSKKDLMFLAKAAADVTKAEDLEGVISSLLSVDKELYTKYSEEARSDKSPAAIGKDISDELYWRAQEDNVTAVTSAEDLSYDALTSEDYIFDLWTLVQDDRGEWVREDKIDTYDDYDTARAEATALAKDTPCQLIEVGPDGLLVAWTSRLPDKPLPFENSAPISSSSASKQFKVTPKEVEAASYGGAYDIADDDYFSKDELMEFAYSLEPIIQHLADDEGFGSIVEVSDVYLNGNKLGVAFMIDGAEHSGEVRIDKRRVKWVRDLYKYVTPLFEQIADSFWDYVRPEATDDQRSTWMDIWKDIHLPSYLSELTSSTKAKGQTVEAALVETPQEVVDSLIRILDQYGFTLDPAFETNPGKTWMGAVHLQVINETSHVPAGDFTALRDNVPKALIDAIHDLEDSSNCPITWSFGVNKNGQVTAGLDIMEQYVEDAETIMSASSISKKAIHDKLLNAASQRMQKSDMGFPLSEIADYLIVEEEETEDGVLKIEVRCELDYRGMQKLAEVLDPIVARYDKNAYFDMVAPGIMEAFIFNKKVTADSMTSVKSSRFNFPELPLEPPDYDEPEEHSSIEYIIVDLDDDILVSKDTFEFQGTPEFESEEDDWVLDEYPNIQLDDAENVTEHVLDVIEPQIPAQPGVYRVRGRVKLAYDVLVYVSYESEGPDDGAYIANEDMTEIDFNYKQSSVEQLEVGKD